MKKRLIFAAMEKEVVLSGIRPTGFLHLGNYLGAIKNSVIYFPQPWFKSIKYEPYTTENWSPIEY